MLGAVTEERLLRAWEATLDEQRPRRGVALLAVCRDADARELSRWGVGERDAALFDLRQSIFGRDATAVTACPSCGEYLEAQFDLTGLRPTVPAAVSATIEVGGYVARTRFPTTEDLAAVSDAGEESAALASLVTRCVESVRTPAGADVPLADAPRELFAAAHAQLADRVGGIEAELSLSCTECGDRFPASFDIAVFLLREVEVWAAHVLREIHVLARAYGWDEPTILQLSPRRRRAYIELIEAAR